MKVLTKEKISNHQYITNEDYLICVDAILGRTGKQTYLEKELFSNGSNNKIQVWRTPEEVFSEKTIASFENKPVTIEHPDDFVNSSNYDKLAVGFVRDVSKKKVNGQDVLVGNLIITKNDAIKIIKDGKKFLSCGYDCDIVEKDGEFYQKNIRGNHVALCDNPRAGITMIIDEDSVKEEVFNYNGYNIFLTRYGWLITKGNERIKEVESAEAAKEWINNNLIVKDDNTIIYESLKKVIECIEEITESNFSEEKKKKIIQMLKQIVNGKEV